MSRDELVECAALVRGAARAARLEAIAVRDRAARRARAAARGGGGLRAPIHEDRLFALVRRAWPYRDLPRADFDAVVRDALGRHRDPPRPRHARSSTATA